MKKVTFEITTPTGEREATELTVPTAIVGRSKYCNLRLVDSRISRKHCLLTVSKHALRVRDLDSSTGTFVNGLRVQTAELTDGDTLTIGRFQLVVRIEHAPRPARDLAGSARDLGDTDTQGQRVFGEAPEDDEVPVSSEGQYASVPQGAGVASGRTESAGVENRPEPSGMAETTASQPERSSEAVTRDSGETGVRGPVRSPETSADDRSGGNEAEEHEEMSPEDDLQEQTTNTGNAGKPTPSPVVRRARAAPDKAGISSDAVAQVRPRASRSRVSEAAHDELFAPDVPPGAEDGFAAAPGRGVSLLSTLRHKWTILLLTTLVAAPAITAVWMLTVLEYKAKAELRVKSNIPYLVFRTEDNGAIGAHFTNTQVAIMRSPTVLQRVLDRKDVQQTRWYSDPPKPLLGGQELTPMERLREGLSVAPRQRTEIIDVSLTARSAKDATTIVNAVIDQYVGYGSETSTSARDDIYRQLADQYKSLENEIEGRQKVLAKLRQELGTSVPAELVANKRVRLDEAEAEYTAVRLKISTAEWRQKNLEAAIEKIKGRGKSDGTDAAPTGVPATQPARQQPKYRLDGDWRQMNVRIKGIQHQIESARKDYKPGHPTMVRLASDLKFAEEMLALRQTQLDEDWKDRLRLLAIRVLPGQPAIDPENPEAAYEAQLKPVKVELVLLKHQSELLLAEAKTQREEFAQTFQSAQMLEKENQALSHKRQLFLAVRTRLDHKEMERNSPGRIEVLTRALAPSKPSKDRRIVFTMMALVAGMGLGFVAAFLRAGRNQAIYTPDDLPVNAAHGPFLGQLPLVTQTGKTGVEGNPMLLEGMRMVRTALISRIDDSRGSAIMVSSADSGAGKTTFAVILARSLAQAGKSILLIDSDLRKKDLTRRFGLAKERGFVESLHARSLDRGCVFPTQVPGLDFMPAGQRNGGLELELTANGAFESLIGRARSEYDIVLLDSPPILPVADARILSRQVDGTILIVRQESCQRSEVVEALACLGSSGGKLMGTVFLAAPQRALCQRRCENGVNRAV